MPAHPPIRFLFAAVAAFGLASFPGRSDACSCIDPGSVSAGFDASGSVLEGKVLSLRHEPASHRVTARLEVVQRWKGAPGKTVEVVTADQGSMCGFELRRGARYVIFARETASPLSVSLCSLSKASDAAAADIAELNRLAQATPSNSGSVSPAADAGTGDARKPEASPVEPLPAATAAPPPPSPASPPSPPAVPKPAERRAPGGSCTGCAFPRGATGSGILLALTAGLLGTRAARRLRKR